MEEEEEALARLEMTMASPGSSGARTSSAAASSGMPCVEDSSPESIKSCMSMAGEDAATTSGEPFVGGDNSNQSAARRRRCTCRSLADLRCSARRSTSVSEMVASASLRSRSSIFLCSLAVLPEASVSSSGARQALRLLAPSAARTSSKLAARRMPGICLDCCSFALLGVPRRSGLQWPPPPTLENAPCHSKS